MFNLEFLFAKFVIESKYLFIPLAIFILIFIAYTTITIQLKAHSLSDSLKSNFDFLDTGTLQNQAIYVRAPVRSHFMKKIAISSEF